MRKKFTYFIAGCFSLVCLSQMTAANIPGEGFLRFEAIQNEGKIDIVWKINPTSQVKKFVILRSKDGINFSPLTELLGSASAPEYGDYIESDYSPYSGTSYYRLMEEDNDGQIFYSEIVPVNMQFSNGKWYIVSGTNIKAVRSELSKLKDSEVLVVLRDKSGNEFFTEIILKTTSGKVLQAKLAGANVPAGKYQVIASSKDELYSKSIDISK